jgi:hypothetical protein
LIGEAKPAGKAYPPKIAGQFRFDGDHEKEISGGRRAAHLCALSAPR